MGRRAVLWLAWVSLGGAVTVQLEPGGGDPGVWMDEVRVTGVTTENTVCGVATMTFTGRPGVVDVCRGVSDLSDIAMFTVTSVSSAELLFAYALARAGPAEPWAKLWAPATQVYAVTTDTSTNTTEKRPDGGSFMVRSGAATTLHWVITHTEEGCWTTASWVRALDTTWITIVPVWSRTSRYSLDLCADSCRYHPDGPYPYFAIGFHPGSPDALCYCLRDTPRVPSDADCARRCDVNYDQKCGSRQEWLTGEIDPTPVAVARTLIPPAASGTTPQPIEATLSPPIAAPQPTPVPPTAQPTPAPPTAVPPTVTPPTLTGMPSTATPPRVAPSVPRASSTPGTITTTPQPRQLPSLEPRQFAGEATLEPAVEGELPAPNETDLLVAEVENSVQVAGAIGSVSAALTMSPTAISTIGKLSLVTNMRCVPEGDSDDAEPLLWQLHPFQGGLGDHKHRYFVGAVVYNFLCICGMAALCWVMRRLQLWRHAFGALILPVFFLYPGTSFAAAKLVFFWGDGVPVIANLIGLVALTGCVLIPFCLWHRVLGRQAFRGTTIADRDAKGSRLSAFFFGSQMWVSLGSSSDFVPKHRASFGQYRYGMHRFLLYELITILVLALLSALQPTEPDAFACHFRNMSLVVWLGMYFLVTLIGRPFLSMFENIVAVMNALLMASAMAMSSLHFTFRNDVAHSQGELELSVSLYAASAYMAATKSICDVLIYFGAGRARRRVAAQIVADDFVVAACEDAGSESGHVSDSMLHRPGASALAACNRPALPHPLEPEAALRKGMHAQDEEAAILDEGTAASESASLRSHGSPARAQSVATVPADDSSFNNELGTSLLGRTVTPCDDMPQSPAGLPDTPVLLSVNTVKKSTLRWSSTRLLSSVPVKPSAPGDDASRSVGALPFALATHARATSQMLPSLPPAALNEARNKTPPGRRLGAAMRHSFLLRGGQVGPSPSPPPPPMRDRPTTPHIIAGDSTRTPLSFGAVGAATQKAGGGPLTPVEAQLPPPASANGTPARTPQAAPPGAAVGSERGEGRRLRTVHSLPLVRPLDARQRTTMPRLLPPAAAGNDARVL